jgi:hypothetical protein
MQLGLCPACGTPYAAADVAGLGILRPRPAAAGGPTIEYRCGQCARVIVLVPYGEGRYAPPGEPPPPPVPPEMRRPPWTDGARAPGTTAVPPVPPPAARPSGPAPTPHREAPRTAPPEAPPAPVGPQEALELLGIAPTASRAEIEQAFRTRSLTCHPDKVAHLDPDFQALAHHKFKRLLEAYRLLVG